MFRTTSKSKNKQMAITPKLVKLQFLCTAYQPDEIYLPTKFHVDTFSELCPGQEKR
jgi:hypothetical protein